MRFPTSRMLVWTVATAITITTSTTITTASAFIGQRTTFISRRSVTETISTKMRSITNRGNSNNRGSTMVMLLGNLFGGSSSSSSSGAYQKTIDYTALDHPGPELGRFAEQGLVPAHSERDPHLALATFAGGCFWGLELAYQRVPGVVYTATGYSQGPELYPNYSQVCSGATGHTEAVIVYYDPKDVLYDQLLDTFFSRVNPLTVNGQGNDFGRQYRTGVYTHSPEQAAIAKARFEQEQKKHNRPIATELLPAKPFWPAEKYHQQYLEKGGRFNMPQNASKGATDTIRCYG